MEDSLQKELAEFIDSSLKGYPDRRHYQDVYKRDVWACDTPLFNFHIQLEKTSARFRFTIMFTREFPFSLHIKKFRLKQQLGQNWYTVKARNTLSKSLMEQPEFHPLANRLSFFDSIDLKTDRLLCVREVKSVKDLEEWPKTLGSCIRFIRFLVNFAKRPKSLDSSDAVCPYCRGDILPGEKNVSCSGCRTVHHQPCWNETGRCSVFGCGSKSEIVLGASGKE